MRRWCPRDKLVVNDECDPVGLDGLTSPMMNINLKTKIIPTLERFRILRYPRKRSQRGHSGSPGGVLEVLEVVSPAVLGHSGSSEALRPTGIGDLAGRDHGGRYGTLDCTTLYSPWGTPLDQCSEVPLRSRS